MSNNLLTRLAASGLADQFEAVNRKAVALTREAAAGPESMAETMGALEVDVLGINCGRSMAENARAIMG